MTIIRMMVLSVLLVAQGPVWGGLEEGFEAVTRGDYNAALQEWRPLAEQGDANAQHNLGVIYEYGYGTRQDYKKAMSWYLKAARQGLAAAQYNLGVMYHNGEGVPRDYVQAHMWFSIAGENGIEEVTRNLDIVTKKMTSTQVADAQRLAREWLQKQKHPLRVGQ